jgi:hypothetical protein
MTRSNFNTIIRKDGEDYGAIFNGEIKNSPIPFLFPQHVTKAVLMDKLNDDQKELFDEYFLVIPIKVVDLSKVN